MSDEWCEGMLLKEFLSGRSPMGDASARKDEVDALGIITLSPAKCFKRYSPPRIERGKLLEVA